MTHLRISYLFTTFPVESETFLQREVRAMGDLPVDMEIHSIHRGHDEFEGMRVNRFHKLELFKLLWWLPYWLLRKPAPILKLLRIMLTRDPPCFINFQENLIGFAFALVRAAYFEKNKPDMYHAVWATAPASAGMLLRELTGVPYSMGAHAYDVFRCGGDWMLAEKLKTARLVHTTTEAARKVLFEKRSDIEGKTILIRRGLNSFPEFKPLRRHRKPIRILSVGRLIEKKGYFEQLEMYRYFKDKGLLFEARVAGWGPLERTLRARKLNLDLKRETLFLGKLDYTGVMEQYEWADVLIFCGKVARDGDRDGLPNVIAEAMSMGLPVLSTDVGGTAEAVVDGVTGYVLELNAPARWKRVLEQLQEDDEEAERVRVAAREWVTREFNARKNAATLSEALKKAAEMDSGDNPGL